MVEHLPVFVAYFIIVSVAFRLLQIQFAGTPFGAALAFIH